MADSNNIIGAFSADHVVRLTGLSRGQLANWDKTGFFSPQYASEHRRDPDRLLVRQVGKCQPGGSLRDKEVIAAADKAGIAMVFTGMRHFRH